MGVRTLAGRRRDSQLERQEEAEERRSERRTPEKEKEERRKKQKKKKKELELTKFPGNFAGPIFLVKCSILLASCSFSLFNFDISFAIEVKTLFLSWQE